MGERAVRGPIVYSIPDEALSNTSYLVELGRGLAIAIDPRRDIDGHLELADRLGVQIVASLETHLHADFVSGSPELAAATGAEVMVPAEIAPAFPHKGLVDGDRVEWGDVVVQVLATPGHTPEHLAYVLLVDDRPTALFSGGSLILGGAARTDLMGDAQTKSLARAQFRSLRRLAELPDETAVDPTHGAGSFCLAAATPAANPTIGTERRTNPLLQIDDEDAFIRQLVAGFGTFPTYYGYLREVNRRGPTPLRDLAEPAALDPVATVAALDDGAWLVDARPIHDWAVLHPEGAVSIELRPAFASWLGWVVPFGVPLVLLVADDRRAEALRLARRIGYDRVIGWLDGGVEAWREAGLPTRSVVETDPDGARRAVASGAVMLDVRQRSELAGGRVPGARHVELGDIVAGGAADLGDVITYCGHGERSATAASLLERRGVRVANLVGGIGAWEAAGLPLDR